MRASGVTGHVHLYVEQNAHCVLWVAAVRTLCLVGGSCTHTVSCGWQLYAHCVLWVAAVRTLCLVGGSCTHTVSCGWQLYAHCVLWVAAVRTLCLVGGSCTHISLTCPTHCEFALAI